MQTRRKSNVTLSGSVITEKGLDAKQEWIKKLKEEALLTTGHGIPRIVDSSSRIFRIIWIVCFLGSLGMCIYMVVRCINQYLKYEVATSQEYVDQTEMDFPTISFCNVNTFASREAYEYLRNYYNTKYKVNVTTFADLTQLVENNTVKYDTDWLLYQTYDPNFNQTLKRTLDVGPYSMFSYCMINNKPCDPSEFVWYYSALYGTCYKFNSGFDENGNAVPIYKINKEGGGLAVQVFTGLSDLEYNYLFEMDYRGIVILVDDQPNFLIKNEGILNSGVYAKVSLTKVITELLPPPYGLCLPVNQINTTLANEMRQLGYNYSRKNCITFCEQHQTIKKLGCYDLRLPRIYNAKPCDSEELFYKLNELTFDYSECNDVCPFECSSISYTLSTSYASYPTYNFYVTELTQTPTYYEDLFRVKDVTYQIYADGLGGVFIGFDKLRYSKLSNKPLFEIMDIFANVGGTLGLFLGFSILSFVELFDLIYKVVLATIKVYKTRSELREEIAATVEKADYKQRF